MRLETYEVDMAQVSQHSIGSRFGARSTAAEVIDGIDLEGRRYVVTGGYSGIGLETVRALVAAGAEVTVPARSVSKASEALAQMGKSVRVAEMDLADLASVRRFADEYAADGEPLHGLINNAGVMASPLQYIGPGWSCSLPFAISVTSSLPAG